MKVKLVTGSSSVTTGMVAGTYNS